MLVATYRSFKGKISTLRSSDSSGEWKFRAKLMVALAIPIFLETLDYTVVATAQGEIASEFNRLDQQSYIGTLYLLTATVFLPFFASVADIYGRHFAIQASFVFFILGSALSTGAKNMEMMLAGRAIAGVGAAGLLTVVRVILSDSDSLDANNWQVSVLFLLYAIGYSVGPVIGGYLANVSFRWIFAINLPACVSAMILVAVLLRKHLRKGFVVDQFSPDGKSADMTFLGKFLKIDWIGTTLFTSGGILVLLALNWGSSEGWNTAKVIACFVVGGIIFVPCFVWQYYLGRQANLRIPPTSPLLSAYPIIPLDVFRNYDVVTVQAASFAGGMVMIVMFYFVATFLTIVSGLEPKGAGVQLVYFAPGSGGGTLLAIYLISRLRQPRYPIMLGSVVLPISLGLVSMAVQQEDQASIKGYVAMAGVGCGLTLGSLNVQARFSQAPERVAVVAALSLFFRSLGGTVGLAQCGAVLNAKARAYIAAAIASGRIPPEFASSFGSQYTGNIGSLKSINELPQAMQVVVREAFRDGVRWCFISLVPWAAVAFLLTLYLSDIPDSESQGKMSERKEDSKESEMELNRVPDIERELKSRDIREAS
ncbi:hypothetical protein PQX77_006464 [Marasmius sp. AFHP31]|nr:hypothetical protein PQX77_006464 [Marasmius sp. AFHP31]